MRTLSDVVIGHTYLCLIGGVNTLVTASEKLADGRVYVVTQDECRAGYYSIPPYLFPAPSEGRAVSVVKQVTFISAADLGLTQDQIEDVADYLETTYGDANWTLVTAGTFLDAVECCVLSDRAATVRTILHNNPVDYVAFPG